ncbi:MAG: hypothetical protein M1358_22980 [Chloroflexi bacterium]|nr:hypothetical protein [Chloroflexota bacterium]
MLEKKIYLCKSGGCCPAVHFCGNEVRIGEDRNLAVLKKEEWNILVEKIRSGELREL